MQDATCIICMEPVGDGRSYSTMVCPACQHAWFHRVCIQVGALSSPCGHRRCSAAAGPAHTHVFHVSAAGTGLALRDLSLPMPPLQRLGRVYSRYAPHGDPHPIQVGVFQPALEM